MHSVVGETEILKGDAKKSKVPKSIFGDWRYGPDISDEQFEILQTFICNVYKHKGERVKLLRDKLPSSRQVKLEAKSIPPCFDSLQLHFRKAAYQSHI